MRLKVIYAGDLDTELDSKIRKAMESIGAEWYGQGMELSTRRRDIHFEYKLPAKEDQGEQK